MRTYFFYYDGRFSADVAFPFVALNMMYRVLSVEKSGRFLGNHVEDFPANAAEIQGKLRVCDVSSLDRLRHFGVGVMRGTGAYWADRSGDVDARSHYRVGRKNGAPTLFITCSCAEFRWLVLLDRLEERIYIAKDEVDDLREDNSRRYQAAQDYAIVVQEFPQERLELYIKFAIIPIKALLVPI